MAMLHFLYNCLGGNKSTKKMFFKIHILYIEEGPAIYGWSPELTEKHRHLITSTCEKYQFPYTIVPLESVFDIKQDMLNDTASQEELDSVVYKTLHQDLLINGCIEVGDLEAHRAQLQKLVGSLDASFAADLCFFLKKQLIAIFCLDYNFKRVLLATTGHSVATQLIGALAKGRGASIYNEVAYFDDKYFGGRVSFCNPMKEFLQKEIAIFNHKNGVKIIAQKSLAMIRNAMTKQPPFFGSTDLLVEGFFNRMQAGYNVNTVPTVIRLTQKLQKQDYSGQAYPFCPLCFGPRDKINNLLEVGSTIKAINKTEDGQIQFVSVKSSDEWFSTQIEKAFCFGCKRLCVETDNSKVGDKSAFIELLPQFIKDNAIRALKFDEE